MLKEHFIAAAAAAAADAEPDGGAFLSLRFGQIFLRLKSGSK